MRRTILAPLHYGRPDVLRFRSGFRHRFALFAAILLFAVAASPARAQLTPEPPGREFFGLNQPIPVRLDPPEKAGSNLEIAIYRWGEDEPLDRRFADPGVVDLADLFPDLWASPSGTIRIAQVIDDGKPVGQPLVLDPMTTPALAKNENLKRAALHAFDTGDRVGLQQLFDLNSRARLQLRPDVVYITPEQGVAFAGLRIYPLPHIVFETDKGEIEFRLRPDMAPRSTRYVIDLVERGFYTNIPVHRIVADSSAGVPFVIQFGDPTGSGAGNAGFYMDLEPSELQHRFGTLSVARTPELNTNSSQLFICLSREAGVNFDGAYSCFAELVRGADAVLAMERVQTDNEDRPSEPLVIRSARAIPAPPITQSPEPLERPQPASRER